MRAYHPPSLNGRGERGGRLSEVSGLSVPTILVNEDELGQRFKGRCTIRAGASENVRTTWCKSRAGTITIYGSITKFRHLPSPFFTLLASTVNVNPKYIRIVIGARSI